MTAPLIQSAEEIIAERQRDRHESTCDDRFESLRERIVSIPRSRMIRRESAELSSIAEILREIAIDCEALDSFQHEAPAPLTDNESEDAVACYEWEHKGWLICAKPIAMTEEPLPIHAIGSRPNECFTCARTIDNAR